MSLGGEGCFCHVAALALFAVASRRHVLELNSEVSHKFYLQQVLLVFYLRDSGTDTGCLTWDLLKLKGFWVFLMS